MRASLFAAALFCTALACACSPKNFINASSGPFPLPAGDTFGVCSISVMNLREEPDFAGEAATQVLMGTLVRILDHHSYWTKVETPDGYQAWVTSGSLQCLTTDEAYAYKTSPKIIITSNYSSLRSGQRGSKRTICDLVKGCMLELVETRPSQYLCRTPDGREGMVPRCDARPFGKYISALQPTPEDIVYTGKEYMGVPYMWGGSSVKAVDCSGFTQCVYRDCGILLPRNASAQVKCGAQASIEDEGIHLIKGDLIFFGRRRSDGTVGIYHVALYTGNGEFIHSAGGRVRVNSLIKERSNYYSGCPDIVCARRILGAAGPGSGFSEIISNPWYF